MKREERMFLKLEPCGFEDCHAFERGRCVALNDTDFGERRCPFYRSRADNANEAAACMDRLARIGRKDLIDKYHAVYPNLITGSAVKDGIMVFRQELEEMKREFDESHRAEGGWYE